MAAETKGPEEQSTGQKCPRVQVRNWEPPQEGGAGKMSLCKHGKLIRQVTGMWNRASDMNIHSALDTKTKHARAEQIPLVFCEVVSIGKKKALAPFLNPL